MNVRIGVMVASALLAASNGSAQKMFTGLAAGGTYSDFENPDTESRWGFTGGIVFGVATTRSLTLLEASYTQKGGAGARIDYVEFGLTGGAIAGRPGGARLRAYGGFSVAFPLECSAPDAPIGGGAFCDDTKTEWGGPVGLNIGKETAGGGFFGLDVRYTLPLSDASLEVYNNSWMFRVMLGRSTTRRRDPEPRTP